MGNNCGIIISLPGGGGLAHWCRATPETNVQDHTPGRNITITNITLNMLMF